MLFYEDVRNALGGLFLSIVTHVEMINYLVSISAINGHGLSQIAKDLVDYVGVTQLTFIIERSIYVDSTNNIRGSNETAIRC